MAVWQERAERKPSGGKYHKYRDKRKFALARQNVYTKIAEVEKRKVVFAMGNTKKVRSMTVATGNLYNPKTKKHSKVKVTKVAENPASRHYARMNVVTKGAIVDTDAGTARVTNRPGQEGFVNLILIEQKAAEPEKKVVKKKPEPKEEPKKGSIISRILPKKEEPKPAKKAAEKAAAKKAPAKNKATVRKPTAKKTK